MRPAAPAFAAAPRIPGQSDPGHRHSRCCCGTPGLPTRRDRQDLHPAAAEA